MRTKVFLVLALCVLFAPQAGYSSSLTGQDDTDFQNAVDLWLADDDRNSLANLAVLAARGNRAARLLLARIEGTDRAASPFMRSLSRTERLDIYRPPKSSGAFYSSWLREESKAGNELADAFLVSGALGINIDGIDHLFHLGEPEAAEHMIRKIATDGGNEQRKKVLALIGETHELTPYVSAFLTMHEGPTTGLAALRYMLGKNGSTLSLDDPGTRAAARFADIGYQAGRHAFFYTPDNPYFMAIAEWVLSTGIASPLARVCRQACAPEALSGCANLAFGLMGGYYEIIRLDSPLESVIPQDIFLNSARATGMVLRKMISFRAEQGDPVFTEAALKSKSRCLASVLLAP